MKRRALEVTASTIGQGSPALFAGKPYRYKGRAGWVGAPTIDSLQDLDDQATPPAIVKLLHLILAARSPELSALVDEFEALPEGPPAWDEAEEAATAYKPRSEARQERAREFAGLMARGLSKKAAARTLGISIRTATEYEQDIREANAA